MTTLTFKNLKDWDLHIYTGLRFYECFVTKTPMSPNLLGKQDKSIGKHANMQRKKNHKT
jgi:hypothetical protein